MARAGRHETQTVRSASISEMLGHPRHPVMVDPSCGWPSISEMLGRRIASTRRVTGCGWPSNSEMLGLRRVTDVSTDRNGWTSGSEMLGRRGKRGMITDMLRLDLDIINARTHGDVGQLSDRKNVVKGKK